MSTVMLETCREMKWINKYMKKCIRLVINKNLWRDARSTKYTKCLSSQYPVVQLSKSLCIMDRTSWQEEPPSPPPQKTDCIHAFIHTLICLTRRSKALPKRVLHKVRSSPFFFNFQYTLVALRPSRSCLHHLPYLPAPSTLPAAIPSIKCFRRQFLRRCDQFS